MTAAGEARAELADVPIAVRMALHTCSPHPTGEGYVGADVHLGGQRRRAGRSARGSGHRQEFACLSLTEAAEHALSLD